MQSFFNLPSNRISVSLVIKTTILVLFGLLYSISAYTKSIVRSGEAVVIEDIYKILDKDLIKISFTKGSSELSDESRTALVNFSKSTRNEYKVDRFIIASWSDLNYPSKGELSAPQNELAELRAKHIKSALQSTGAEQVDSFIMTKRPNWIQRAFSTETAEIKNQGSNRTSNQRLLKSVGKKLKENGGPMSAVVVAKFTNEVSVK